MKLVDYAKVVVVALFFVCEECFGGKGRKVLETGLPGIPTRLKNLGEISME